MNNKDIECNKTVKRKKRIIVIMINTSKEVAELYNEVVRGKEKVEK